MKKRNGSVLVTTLLCVGILSCICLGCMSLIRTNSDIISTYEVATILQHDTRAGVNLVYSKTLEHVNKAIEISKQQGVSYNEYFVNTHKEAFIKEIENIDENNIEVNIINDKIYRDENFICFKVECVKNKSDLKKQSTSLFKIKADLDVVDCEKIVYKYDYKEI